LRFITDRIDHRGRWGVGRDVAAQWDAAYPDWAYRGNTRRMWRDHKRALQQVAPEAAINQTVVSVPDSSYTIYTNGTPMQVHTGGSGYVRWTEIPHR
jgi:hypothetical protein